MEPAFLDTQECDYDDDFLFEEQNDKIFEVLKIIAKKYMVSFFSDKDSFLGGKIKDDVLLDENNLNMVLNYDIITSVNIAYSSLKEYDIADTFLGEVPGDVRLVNGILQILSSSKIPQQFAGGMMLIYLKLIKGIEIG